MTSSAADIQHRQPQPELAVSTVVFAINPDAEEETQITLPLVRRIAEPFLGRFAIPGGPLLAEESLDHAAFRTLDAVTGLKSEDIAPTQLSQMHTFGGLHRSPGLRVVTVVYWVLLPLRLVETATQFSADDPNVIWSPVTDLPELAFDHEQILQASRKRLSKLSAADAAHNALEEKFTLAQLREVMEVITGQSIDAGNFQRRMRSDSRITPTQEFLRGTSHRPPRLYTVGPPEPAPL